MADKDPIADLIRWFIKKPNESEAASVRRYDRLGKKTDELRWAADTVLEDVAEFRRRRAEERK